MEPVARTVQYIRTRDGACPFEEWLLSIPVSVRAAIAKRIDRIEKGLLGDYESIGEGLIEFRVHLGPGYRLYGAIRGDLVILLAGSDKAQQQRTISIARTLWDEYKRRIG